MDILYHKASEDSFNGNIYHQKKEYCETVAGRPVDRIPIYAPIRWKPADPRNQPLMIGKPNPIISN